MLTWAVMFLALAIVAGLLGFTGTAGTAAWIVRALFIILLIAFIIAIFAGRRRRPPFA